MTGIRSTPLDRNSKKEINSARMGARQLELIALVAATILIGLGLRTVYQAKILKPTQFIDVEQLKAENRLINLNKISDSEALVSYLTIFKNPADRKFAARKIYDYLTSYGRGELPNVGAIAKLRATEEEIISEPQLDFYRAEIDKARQSRANVANPQVSHNLSVPLIRQLGRIKPSFVVREPEEFLRSFYLWGSLYLVGFYAVHVFWRWRGFNGDGLILPLLHLLTGIGLIMMVSLRDPLRDTLNFADFSLGVLIGCILLMAFSLVDYDRLFKGLSFVPLLLSFCLSVLLILFGSGPSGTDVKVNLFGFQPVEIIKLLIIFFLAAYFAKRWEFLRELKEKSLAFSGALRLNVPRLDYMLPVVISMCVILIFFFLQKDLGPALVLSFLFLTLYTVARNRFVMAAFGILLILGGFFLNYKLSTFPSVATLPVLGHLVSSTVAERIQIWLSPWDNSVRGGEQLVHSLWALSTGGVSGTGIGQGDPNLVPAVHTDLILSAIGEELGFIGLLLIFIIYTLLVYRGMRIGFRSISNYLLFLSIGLTLLFALQMLLIAGGILGLIPLSGVVSPFLSYGRTSMLVNFALAGILLSNSREQGAKTRSEFRTAAKWLPALVVILAVVALGKAAYVQVFRKDHTMIAGTLTMQADGVRRFQYNPRIFQAARSLPKGSIYDRNGIPLATSDWDELERHRKDYEALGINIDETCERNDSRHYPFGARLFYLLGDTRTRFNWAATNSAYLERTSMSRLQGYDDHATKQAVIDPQTGKTTFPTKRDFSELIPLLRYRYNPSHEDVQRIINRERDLRTSIDVKLQLRASDILRDRILRSREKKGAIVILDPETGDLLACVSYPWPDESLMNATQDDDVSAEEDVDLLDRARYGLYPPGSTFKLVTAVAALRKDINLANVTYQCVSLGDGRVGNSIRGYRAPIRDDIGDRSPHGAVKLEKGIIHSCNAYFAQLGTYSVQSEALLHTAETFGISVADPNTPEQLNKSLPQSSYGQGQVVATPFQMARVSATIANYGKMNYGRWVTDESNIRTQEPQSILSRSQAEMIGRAMRGVVTQGTARSLSGIIPTIAGKTGTAEVERGDSHAWFVGFAPYEGSARKRIAFAIIVENGGYGGRAAVPIANEIVSAAHILGII